MKVNIFLYPLQSGFVLNINFVVLCYEFLTQNWGVEKIFPYDNVYILQLVGVISKSVIVNRDICQNI